MSDSKASEKRVVGRNVAIVLGITWIILIAVIGGLIAYYTMRVDSLSSQNTNLQNQINDLNVTLNLGKSYVWDINQTVGQPAGEYFSWEWYKSARALPYSGYISVQVLSSTTSNTYVRAIYSIDGINYDNSITVGTGGTAVFPVVAPVDLIIRVGNTNLLYPANETVTITYYY